jgi:signal peptidase I
VGNETNFPSFSVFTLATQPDVVCGQSPNGKCGMDIAMDAREELKSQLFLEVLRSVGTARFAVTGDSMLPAVWPGDILEVRRVSVVEIVPGQLALFKRDGRLFAHRVVEQVNEQGRTFLITRGDRLRKPDLPVLPEELVGQVTAIERGDRRLAPRATRSAPIVSWILCRSDFATGLLLRLGEMVRRIGRDKPPDPVLRAVLSSNGIKK